jgi:hypothetical protein
MPRTLPLHRRGQAHGFKVRRNDAEIATARPIKGTSAIRGEGNPPSVGTMISAAILALTAVALFASSASATTTRPYTGVSFGPQGTGAAGGAFSEVHSITVDPANGDVLVYDGVAEKLYKFGPAGEPANFSGLAGNVIENAGNGSFSEPGIEQVAVAPPGSPAGTAGDIYIANTRSVRVFSPAGLEIGSLGEGEPCGVAVDPAGHLFIGGFPSTVSEYIPSANPPTNSDLKATGTAAVKVCNVAVAGAETIYAAGFQGGQIAKLAGLSDPAPTIITPGARTIASVPATSALLADRGDSVAEYDAGGTLVLTFGEKELTGSAGIAVGSSGASGESVYVGDGNKVKIFGPVVTLPEPETGPATKTASGDVTLTGTVNPAGEQLTQCVFEYGLTSEAGFPSKAPCVPATIPADTRSHAVSATISGLRANSAYHYRLSAANAGGGAQGLSLTFTTFGPPQIEEVRALNADQTSATLEARINPSGFPTRYRIEWGSTTAYGNSIPTKGFEPSIGNGEQLVLVTAELSGLAPASLYHYRVVATNSDGREIKSPDRIVETLDSCGLPENRCFELVSPRDVGPTDIPGFPAGNIELHYQAANNPGELAYVSEGGLPSATKGAEVLYKAVRGPDGWTSTQLSPPITAPTQNLVGSSNSSQFFALNEDLNCGVVASNQPLTADAGTRAVVEAGGGNLYRQDSGGGYTAITQLSPTDPDQPLLPGFNSFRFEAMSRTCGKVIFAAPYLYPRVPAIVPPGDGKPLYEWDEGTLRGLGYVPGPSGEVLVEAHTAPHPPEGGGGGGRTNTNVVSADGSRVFFGAPRQISGNPEEIGKEGVFVTEDTENGRTTRDLSLSKTSIPDRGAEFQYATSDGDRVFFLANAGLTDQSNAEGRDLYEFDLRTNSLTDLSLAPEEGEAAVAGFIGASTDGSQVYFLARGELVTGKGASLAENQRNGTYSIYRAESGRLSYVGAIGASDSDYLHAIVGGAQTAKVSEDGRYLLFESSETITGYENQTGAPEAYIYDAAEPPGTLECVSCRQDGRSSLAPSESRILASSQHTAAPGAGNEANAAFGPRALVVRNGGPVVFFNSFNSLAPGGADGVNGIFEWAHGQVFRIASEPINLSDPEHTTFVGASQGGTDLYFVTPQTLTWEDGDERISVYDARVDGGFPEPAHPAGPCDPLAETEGSCSGGNPGAESPGAPPVTQVQVGPGNAKHKKKQHKKKQHKKKHHKKGKKKQQQGKHKKARHKGNDRGAGK